MCMARKRILCLTYFLAKMHFWGRNSKTHRKPCASRLHTSTPLILVTMKRLSDRESQLPKAVLPQYPLSKSMVLDHVLLGNSKEILQCCCSCLENSPNLMQTALRNKATKECCSRALSWAARCKIYYDTVQGISEREVKALMCLFLLFLSVFFIFFFL